MPSHLFSAWSTPDYCPQPLLVLKMRAASCLEGMRAPRCLMLVVPKPWSRHGWASL